MHPRLPARRPVGIAVPTASKRSASALLAAALLASSTDLGPSRSADTQITVTLDEAARPDALIDWSEARNLSVRWRPGDGWAIVEGAAGDLGRAFGVPVHDYRALKGKVFYASPSQPAVPSVLHGVVTAVGRIMSYAPHHTKAPGFLPLDVPAGGLTPAGLLSVYNASPLVDAGFTGEGATIVIFSFDSAGQEDPDLFADTSVLPRFTPEIVGGKPAEKRGETAMDLWRMPLHPTRGWWSSTPGRRWRATARTRSSADCSNRWTATIPARCGVCRSAGDARCSSAQPISRRWRRRWLPRSVASLPMMTSVGGTTLSTGTRGQWLGEDGGWIPAVAGQ